MAKSTTLESFQAAQIEPPREPSPLAQLAERMVRERTPAMADDEITEQLEGLNLIDEIDAHMALGEIKSRVWSAADAASIPATAEQIDAEAERIWTFYGDTRRASEAHYSVGPDGLVDGYRTTISANGQTAELGTPEAREIVAGAIQGAFGEVPQKPLEVPKDSQFTPDGWLDSGALANRARALIERHDALEHLHNASISYLWKKQGGKSYGRPIMGRAVKVGGLLKHFAASTWVIWLAADHIRAAAYKDRGIERMLFRQLLCAGVSEVDENTGRGGGPTFAPPEVQVHLAEIEVYGLEDPAVKEAATLIQQATQPSLFDAPSDPSAVFADLDAAMGVDVPTCDSAQIAELVNSQPADPLVCSVCTEPVWEHELTADEIATMRANPAVVLCEACGEDGILDDGLDGEAAG